MKNFYYFLLPLLLFISCTKSLVETGSVSGIVKDATTGEPIANADVFLLQNEIGDGDIWSGGRPSEQIDYTTSDANGNFSFLFDYDKNYSYLCGAEATLYFDLDQEFSVDEDVKDGDNVEVLLNPMAFVELHIKNMTPFDANDRLTMGNLFDGSYPVFYGETVDTVVCCITVTGNFPSLILWYVYKNGVENSFSENAVFNSFDTTYFEILY